MWNPCPMFHIAAMGVSVACVTHGITIVTAPFFEPDSAVELLAREYEPTALFPAYANILLGVLTHPRFEGTARDACAGRRSADDAALAAGPAPRSVRWSRPSA